MKCDCDNQEQPELCKCAKENGMICSCHRQNSSVNNPKDAEIRKATQDKTKKLPA